MELTHLSLFSGIGGLDLAAEWAGFKTVGQCEYADYPTKVLEKHWPDVQRWRDIHELSSRDFVHRTGIRQGELTVISGGFPCQPFSVAGNQKGKEDDRYLWPEMLRVISELHPTYILGENVPGILKIAADDVCKDMEREGYEVGIFNYEVAAVGAPHRRERFFFVGRDANSNNKKAFTEISEWQNTKSRENCKDMANSNCLRMEGKRTEQQTARTCREGENVAYAHCNGRCRFGREPEIGRYTKQVNSIIAKGCNVPNTKSYVSERTMYTWERWKGPSNDSSNVSDSDCSGCEKFDITRESKGEKQCSGIYSEDNVSNADDTTSTRFRTDCRKIFKRAETKGLDISSGSEWWSVEPNVGRVANGIPSRVDRLKCLGNAVVPYQAYPIFQAIAEIEFMISNNS